MIGLSSEPVTSLATRVGASATAATVTVRLSVVVAVSPFASVVVAVTVRSMAPEKSSGGVIVRPASWPGVSVTLPSALTVPAESTAPSGMLVIVRETDSESSVTDADRSSAMALSSSPAASLTASTGASAIAVTVTGRLRLVSAVSPFSSTDVETTVRAMSPEKFSGAVMVRSTS